MHLPVTALFSALHIVFNVALAGNVSRVRAKTNIFLGGADSPELLLAQRRHANNAEYLPLALLALALVELNGGSATALYALGATLTLGRVIHAIGVGPTPSPLRAGGAVLTWLVMAGAAVYAAVLGMH
ncbi:MAG: MAPEG family protein [Deltaproteobacteria bacterium]|nr:MAPEG family protein [Deltaproteobacteria bacterium]